MMTCDVHCTEYKPAGAALVVDEEDSSCSCPSLTSSDGERTSLRPARRRHDRRPPASAAAPDDPPSLPSWMQQDATDAVTASPRKNRPDTSCCAKTVI